VLQGMLFMVNSAHQTRFWEHTWIEKMQLKMRFPDLYRIVRTKNVFVAKVLGSTPLNVSFRRAIVGDRLRRLGGQ